MQKCGELLRLGCILGNRKLAQQTSKLPTSSPYRLAICLQYSRFAQIVQMRRHGFWFLVPSSLTLRLNLLYLCYRNDVGVTGPWLIRITSNLQQRLSVIY